MSVAVLPKRAPVLDGLRPYYEIGEVLQVECTSAPSYPAATLTFLINDKEVNALVTDISSLERSLSGIELILY